MKCICGKDFNYQIKYNKNYQRFDCTKCKTYAVFYADLKMCKLVVKDIDFKIDNYRYDGLLSSLKEDTFLYYLKEELSDRQWISDLIDK